MTVIYQLNQFFFTTFFTIWWLVNRAEDVLRQSPLILRNLLSSNVFCPPPPPLPTQQVEQIWMEMSTRHLFFKFFLFVFHLFFIFLKKKIKKVVTLDPRPSTLDIKMDSFAGKLFLLSPPPPPSFIFFFALVPTFSTNSRRNACYAG